MKNPITLEEFQSYFTESFYSRIKTLEKIIGNRHWLTTGQFKEKVLIDFLNSHLPKSLRAKSGFVIFPCDRLFSDGKIPEYYDDMKTASYDLSKQIDIIIYKINEAVTIYEDNNVIILPPEAVSDIIEVKGVLSHKHLHDAIKQLEDYSLKWMKYKKFLKGHNESKPSLIPNLYIFSWEKARDSLGRNMINEKGIRNILKDYCLSSKVSADDYLKRMKPFIKRIFIYNESISELCTSFDIDKPILGYGSSRGKVTVVKDNNSIEIKGDLTLFTLLQDILSNNNLLTNTNRFTLDVDDTSFVNYNSINENKNFGFTKVLELNIP